MTNRVIDILQMQLDDEVITTLRDEDDEDIHLAEAINAYAISLGGFGKEIFEHGNSYLVCEDCVYLAAYEDDVEEIPDENDLILDFNLDL